MSAIDLQGLLAGAPPPRSAAKRHGNADPDHSAGEVTKDAGDLGYDHNDRESLGTDPWDTAIGKPSAP